MGNILVRLLQRTIPALKQQGQQLSKMEEQNKVLEQEREKQEHMIDTLEKGRLRQQEQLDLLEKVKLQQSLDISVLQEENLALLALLERFKAQLSQVSSLAWLGLGLGALLLSLLWARWRREREARSLAEHRMRLLELPDCVQVKRRDGKSRYLAV